jgi:hypothetical protein
MTDSCVNCGNDDGSQAICVDCLERIDCNCFKGENLIDDIEMASCSRCETEVDATTLVAFGNWELCEICQGDI